MGGLDEDHALRLERGKSEVASISKVLTIDTPSGKVSRMQILFYYRGTIDTSRVGIEILWHPSRLTHSARRHAADVVDSCTVSSASARAYLYSSAT